MTSLQTAAFGVASVTNLAAASGGADAETVAQAKVRAPAVLKAGGRAVTAEDFETIALQTPAAVGRVHASADQPGLPRCARPRRRNRDRGAEFPWPGPGSHRAHPARGLRAELEKHRLITTEVFATGPTYRLVRVIADLIAAPGSDLTVVRMR